MLQYGVEKRRHIGAPLLTRCALCQGSPAINARGINHWEIELFVRSAQFIKQVEGLIHHFVGIGTRLVHFVDNNDRLETQSQSFLGHKTCLGHRALLRVNEQNHAIHHGQGAFHFATEVGVAWGVNDVDVGALPTDSAVLGQNGNTAFTFNGVVVHDGVNDFFVNGKCTGLTQ